MGNGHGSEGLTDEDDELDDSGSPSNGAQISQSNGRRQRMVGFYLYPFASLSSFPLQYEGEDASVPLAAHPKKLTIQEQIDRQTDEHNSIQQKRDLNLNGKRKLDVSSSAPYRSSSVQPYNNRAQALSKQSSRAPSRLPSSHYSSDPWNHDDLSDGLNANDNNDADVDEGLHDQVLANNTTTASKRRRVVARRKHHTPDERDVIDRSYTIFKARVLATGMYAPQDELTAHAINAINEAIFELDKVGAVGVSPSMTRVVSFIILTIFLFIGSTVQ